MKTVLALLWAFVMFGCMAWMLVMLAGAVPYLNSYLTDRYVGYRIVSRPDEELEGGKWVQKYYIYDIIEKHPHKAGVYKAVFYSTSRHPLERKFGLEEYVTTVESDDIWTKRLLGYSFHKMSK